MNAKRSRAGKISGVLTRKRKKRLLKRRIKLIICIGTTAWQSYEDWHRIQTGLQKLRKPLTITARGRKRKKAVSIGKADVSDFESWMLGQRDITDGFMLRTTIEV